MTEQALAEVEQTLPGAYNQATQLLSDIVAASRDPAVDAGKITALANLAMAMQDREAERRFRIAKHNAVMEMPSITKKGAILNKQGQVQSRYSKFEDIDRVCKPILNRHKLIITFNVGHEGQLVTVQPILAYSDGEMAFEERGGEMVLAVDTTGSKNATQGAGSAASYGKRHAYKATLNVIEEGEDDDGQLGVRAGYDALPADKQALVDEARQQALGGAAAYEAYFKSLDTEQRGFLAFNIADDGDSWHNQNKRAALVADQTEGA